MQSRININNRIKTIRHCIEGQDRIKDERDRYLPHPSSLVTAGTAWTAEQTTRYDSFIKYAEFEDYPAQTLRSTRGRMKISQASIELPAGLEILRDDVDGDGTTILDQISLIATEIMQTKYIFCLVDYKGLTGLDDDSLSLADIERLNPRSTILTYPRDSITEVEFKRINGVKQLARIVINEDIDNQLYLELDEEGYYYQQRVNKGGKSDRNYMMLNGARLDYIPGLFIGDEVVNNSLSPQLGFIYPICLKTLAKYQVNAVYKECMRALVPTIYTTGWKHGDSELFKEANNGRAYISASPLAVNNLPQGVTVSVESVTAELGHFENYFKEIDEQIELLGGVTNPAGQVKTATEADLDAVERNAVMIAIAEQIESCYAKLLQMAAEFMAVSGDITVSMFKDFATPKISDGEIKALIELRNNSLISTDEVVRRLEQGGFLVSEVEQVLSEIENTNLIGD